MKANYSYKLHTNRRYTERYMVTYTRAELMEMTTFQLRNICYKEKLVKGLVNTLTRDQLVQMILRYRGAEEHLLIEEYAEGGFARVEAAMQSYLKTPLADNGNIKVPAKMSIYREMKIDATDKYIVETAGLVEESNVLLVNEQQALCAILTLQKDKQQPNRYYFVTDTAMNMQNTKNKNYSFIF